MRALQLKIKLKYTEKAGVLANLNTMHKNFMDKKPNEIHENLIPMKINNHTVQH